jgi:hypothetical protein
MEQVSPFFEVRRKNFRIVGPPFRANDRGELRHQFVHALWGRHPCVGRRVCLFAHSTDVSDGGPWNKLKPCPSFLRSGCGGPAETVVDGPSDTDVGQRHDGDPGKGGVIQLQQHPVKVRGRFIDIALGTEV